jgi:hypothetical protein
MICFTGYLREQAKLAMDAASEEDKKAFALTGGKRNLIFCICFLWNWEQT